MDSRARLLLLLIAGAALSPGPAAALRDRSADDGFALKNKRPFCNAFTGCGRKRSSGGGEAEQATGADLKEQIDEVARHVLGQDRALEQLQQKVELMRALACGYPDMPTQQLYRRRRDVKEHTPVTNGFHSYSSPKQHDFANRAQPPSPSLYYYHNAREELHKERKTRNQDQPPGERSQVAVQAEPKNETEEGTEFDGRNDDVHRAKESVNKSVSDQE